jgi:hypothetical protein
MTSEDIAAVGTDENGSVVEVRSDDRVEMRAFSRSQDP